MKNLEGKKALILGIASNRSIAWGISESLKNNGAELAFTYQNDKLKERVEKLANECGSNIVLPCDVSIDGSISKMLEELSNHWKEFDILIHSLAFAPKEELEGNYVEKTTNTIHLIEDWESLDHQAKYLNWRIETGLLDALDPLLKGGSSAISVALCGQKYTDI